MTDLITQDTLNLRNLSGDPETEGFDLEAGKRWIYPTNYPIRDYQFNIVQQALYKNTLVSLPTGLGKTFIAAVVMYNFYRWYPNGKIIFMAPTRPLVKQQIDACYDIMGIPKEITAELTGTKLHTLRTEIWKNKRVFFITPQILQNDLNNIIELGKQIKCLIFDEAHRAKGNHAYCQVIRQLIQKTHLFRVLALSATPGNSYKDVVEIVNNLQISHLEFRNEDSADVKPYAFQRNLETIVVPLGEKLQQIRDEYIKVLEVYTRTLIRYKVFQGNCANLTKGKIFMTMKEFQSKNNSASNSNYNEIMKSLNICVTLYHAFELLIRHGLRGFLKFFEEHINKPLLSNNNTIISIMDDVREYLGPEPTIETLPDGSFVKMSNQTKFGHPKFYQLRDILMSHFQNNATDSKSRVIVFFEFRESVTEAYALLLQAAPIIRPRVFLGQGYGVTQKIQINVVKAFRDGNCNTLLSTCIGEEGLDVGDVDLIVCFDISNKSPIRMIQRMGRTGRKREGRVIVLVTEGKEQQTLKDCLLYKNNLNNFVLNSKQLMKDINNVSPKMVPNHIQPICEKMFITVKKPELTKNSSLKDMFRNISHNTIKYTDDVQIIEIVERLKAPVQFWNLSNPLETDTKVHFSGSLEKQRSLQATGIVKHSKHGEMLVNLLQFADSKRFNLPVTQDKGFTHRNLKQGDIRSMFTKPNLPPLTQDLSLPEFGKQNEIVPDELFLEISNFLSIELLSDRSCKICSKLFKCPQYVYQQTTTINLNEFTIPDDTVFKNITKQDLDIFAEQLSPKSQELHRQLANDNDVDMEVSMITKEKSFAYETPKSFSNILNKLNSAEEQIEINEKEILTFFKLSSLNDLFITTTEIIDNSQDSEKTIIYNSSAIGNGYDNHVNSISPDLFEDSSSPPHDNLPKSPTKSMISNDNSHSPILSSMERVSRIQAKRKIYLSGTPNQKPQLQKLHVGQIVDSNNGKLKERVDRRSSAYFEGSTNKKEEKQLEISDVCDLSNFGLSTQSIKMNNDREDKVVLNDLDIDDVCDLSIFGLDSTPIKDNRDSDKTVEKSADTTIDLLNVSDIFDVSSFIGDQTKPSTSNDDNADTSRQNIQNNVIDLIESDLKASPLGRKHQLLERAKTQMTVTQMLSLVSKINTKTPPKKSKINHSLTPKSSQSKKTTPKSSSNKKIFNLTICSNSDDEFETSPVFLKPKSNNFIKNNDTNSRKKQKKRKRLFSEFIENEALVSDSENVAVSDDETEDEDNCYEASFIADESHNICTQVHAEYLKSIKSPMKRRQHERRPRVNISNVFSQDVTHEDNTYVNDSFCVDTENIDYKNSDGSLSELEILEKKLKDSKKKKKRTKRRKIVVFSDDDSD